MAADIAEVLARFANYAEVRDGYGSNPFRLRCLLSAGATISEIRAAWKPGTAPPELERAWRVSRESHLFEDVDYGQWGLVLLSPEASAMVTAEQHITRSDQAYLSGDVVIGEFLGDSELLVISPGESGNRRVLVALPLDKRPEWYGVGTSLAEFLERYLEALGAKYWE
jgi:hypothetical protein